MTTLVDTPSRRRTLAPSDLARIAVFAALVSALSLTPAIPLGPVPITLQTLGVALTGLCLGPWRGFAAMALYLAVGAAGLPVFSGGASGVAILVGPTGGYLLSFPLAALLSGFVARWAVRRGLSRVTPFILLGGLLLARYLIILPIAVTHLTRVLGITWMQAVAIDAPFWVVDLAKSVVAVILAVAVHKAFPRLLGR
ncbi:biotin transporter BioY [Tessaracoccus antarcticus]|uniref:Biotin transporter n=1 Tax=Tessaracoccus antarcticus TaxID=2479848 RepID=A0A3M0GB47_9ACTN|nr:biotin transporter BioY [Tessaracoccus antarcticus]RMB59712.1 biotin transporter BioY [Tessaracoccus antarcticus]